MSSNWPINVEVQLTSSNWPMNDELNEKDQLLNPVPTGGRGGM